MTQPLTLKQLGWKRFFADQLTPGTELVPGRVTKQNLNGYEVWNETGRISAILPGRTRVSVSSRAELPTVGDWVLTTPVTEAEQTAGPAVIQQTLERASKFSRREAGHSFDEQVVAANIDIVFVVTGLDDNFNPSRIERYVLLCLNSGATPVIVLNKADLCEDLEARLDAVREIAPGTPVHCISALKNEGVDQLAAYLQEGDTGAVLGSSGVGKSTITNLLIGYDHFATGDVRDGDSKGRHTTSHRELCTIAGGGMIIDTPGMRELQLWSDDQQLSGSFQDIQTLEQQCRFRNCQHGKEPGCAIKNALVSDELSDARWESYCKFQREMEHLAEQQDLNLRLQKKSDRRRISKMIRKLPKKRGA